MSSYLSIYLERKPEEGKEKGERLLLCSISRGSNLYSLFYDNRPGIPSEDNFYEVDSEELIRLSDEIGNNASSEEICIGEKRLNLRLIQDKEAITEVLDQLKSDKEYLKQLRSDESMLTAIALMIYDVGKEWSDFSKVLWRIE